MSKRLISFLLVFVMVLGMFPMTAFANEESSAPADDTVQETQDLSDPVETTEESLLEGTPVKADDFTLEMTLNTWIDMDLSEYFSDPEGDELTYSISTDAEIWEETPAQFRYYPSGDGTRYVYFQASDGVNTSEMLTVTTVVPEVPNSVKVTFSISMGVDKFYQGGVNNTVMVPVELTVPYFDLALYGMDDCYYNPQCYATADGNLGSGTMGNVESADGVVTVMHVLIYATEHLFLGYETKNCGKGNSYSAEQDCLVDADGNQVLSWTGTAGSTYMFLWNHGTNLNYYVDWTYPLGGPKWGSTSDQIALYGGEEISIHNIEDANVQGSNFAFFTLDGEYGPESQADTVTIYQGDELKLTAVRTVPDWDAYTTGYTGNETTLRYIDANLVAGEDAGIITDWTVLGETDGEGNVTIDTTDIAPGTYYVAAEGFVDTYTATETGPAFIKLTVKPQPQDVTITVTQGEEEVEVVDTGLLYSDAKIYFAEVPAYGSFVFNDDLHDKLGTANRYFGFRNALPYTCGVGNYQTLKDYNTIVNRYGEIEGLTAENTKLHAIEVSAMAANGWGRGALQYILVVEIPVIRVESVTLDQTEVKTWGGNQVQLTATVAPENATYPTVSWSSSDTNVAQVSSTGLVSCWLDGTATITATADGVSTTCTITVVDGVPVPTKVYSGNSWPIRGSELNSVTVQKVAVTNTLVNGNNIYVTLSDATADDATFALQLTTTGSGTWIRINGENINADSIKGDNNGTFVEDFQLNDGAATLAIRTMAYWDEPDQESHWSSYGATKTFYFSNTGTFPMAPMMAGGTSTNTLAAEGDTYTINLAPLFQNVSDSEVTYQVSIDGAEAAACDTEYTYTCDTPGTRKLVFNAVNDYGTSPAYTVTLSVLDQDAVQTVNYEIEGAVIEWFAFTDENLNPLPEGTTYSWDAENITFTIVQPTDIDKSAKVKTFYKMVKDDTTKTLPCLTGSSQTAGAGTHWNGAIRYQQTDTLSNGFKDAIVYLAQDSGGYAPSFKTIHFKYERVLPETAFEYKVEDGAAKYTFQSDNGGVNGHSWISTGKNNEVHIALTDVTPDDSVISCVERSVTTTLVDGAGEYKYSTGSSFWGDLKNWTIKYQKDQFPTFVEGVESTVDVELPCLDEYTVDFTKMYTDPDTDDTLTYEVKIGNGAWTKIEGSTYTFIPETKQDYTLQLRCYDGFVYSEDIQTVNITATNATSTYEATVNVDAENAEFYCFTAVTEEEGITWNDQITATKNEESGAYTLDVPVNVSKVVVKIGEALNVISIDAENNAATLAKIDFAFTTLAGDAAEATVTVTTPEGMTQPVGDGNVYYLIPGEGYTFTAVPTEEFSNIWANAVLKEQSVEADATVDVVLPVRGAKTITIDSDADLKVYYQRGYYVLSEVEPAVVTENDNLTTTYIYPTPKTNAYSMGYMYFAKKDGLIDKAGYMMGKSEFTITWRGDERTGDYRAEYDPNYGQGSRGDDSVLVNINAQNHLVLEEGETFRLRSSRIWEIINTDTENVMIEPEYIYTGYDEDIITLTNANEVLTDRVCGTGGNNWMDITVTGKGVTFLEVAYEAVHLVNGYEAGAWGGAGAATSNFTWNAIDPDRTALIVVQTDGMAATDVTFNIDCLSANVDGGVYDASKAVQWDAEFDTVYFLGESREITLAPTAKEGKIVCVEISSDKGESWTELTAEDGVYTAEIFAGNNIIRVTKDDGTTAYQLVRGDKVSAEITLVTDINGDGKAGLGDTVKLQLYGLHFPVGKMSGIYNPGFSWGHRITYTLDGETVQQYDQYQYNFISNAYMTVTIPTDVVAEYVLEDGYINFNIFGDGPGNHRNLTDSGRQVNTSASSAKYCRSLLPEIVIYSCDHAVTEKGKVVAPTCTVEGYTEYVCADCGTVIKGETVEALGHDYTEEVKEATCVEMGYTTYTCACGSSYVDGIVDAFGHKTSSVITEATHDKMGYTTTSCDVCDYEFIHSWTDALEHSYVKTIITEATCTAEGVATFTCACGESYSQSIPVTGHSCEATVTAATCTAFGYTTYQCKSCDYSYINTLVNPVGHKYESVVTAPICTENGYTIYTCAVCKDSYKSDYVAAIGHSESVVGAKEATGHEAGYTGNTVCTVCKAQLEKGSEIAALGCASESFTDIKDNSWFHEAADFVIESGLMNGTSDTTFAPKAETTRAMMATLLYRVAGEPSIEGVENPFDDVEEDAWYYKAVVWAAKTGVVTGTTATTFEPSALVSREQMVTMLWRFADKPVADKTELKDYTDAKNIGSYATDAFAWAIGQGLVTGTTETELNPKGTATRAQIAIILMRYLK